MIGEILGNRYKILRDLGSGGMAWVYLAEDSLEGGTVAVKVLYPQFSLDMAYLQRFVREAKVASGLTSPHIVKVLDYGATRDVHYLVMEHIDGQDLKDILAARTCLPWQEALPIARQVGLALDHAFQFGIVHRDIKPQNLMIAEGGIVKVLDFGIARALTMPSLTLTGFVGSPYYISPEQAKGEQVDIRSDIYSLGVVLFEMLTGKAPFDADNPWAIISQHIEDEPPPLSGCDAEIPPEVVRIVLTALAKPREARFQTPPQMIDAIDAVLVGEQLSPGTETDQDAPSDLDKGIGETYQRGIEAAQNEQWVQARNLFSYALGLAPDFRDAKEQLARTETKIKLQELYASASDAVENKHWEEAASILKEILSADANYKDASDILSQINTSLSALSTEQGEQVQPAEEQQPLDTSQPVAQEAELETKTEATTGAETEAIVSESEPQTVVQRASSSRRWLLGVLIAVLICSALLVGGMELVDRQREQSVRTRYDRAIALHEKGDWEEAIKEFDRVLAMAPDYEDAASKREEATKSRELERLYSEGRSLYEEGNLAEAIPFLSQLRSQNLTFEQSSVDSMLCNAYYEQAVNLSQKVDRKSLQSAIALLDEALEICAADTEILSEKKTLDDYLQVVIDLGDEKWDQVFAELSTLEQIDPDTADPRISQVLYQVYSNFGKKREEEDNPSAALLHYRKALSIPNVDHSQAEQKVSELEERIAALAPTPIPTSKPTETPVPQPKPTATPTPTAQGTPVLEETAVVRYYSAPKLIAPPDGTIFTSGEFGKLTLEWEGPEELAEDEYYDVTVLHFFNEEEIYWGTNTQETQLELSPTIGYSRADKDIFHWFVTIRRAESIDEEGKPDGPPISLRSDAWTFIWR